MFALAESLLRRFGVPQGNESLMGDLVEEYTSGRSVVWLWRETLNAIATTMVRDVRNHKLMAVRAVAIGWLLSMAWLQILRLLLKPGVVHTGAASRSLLFPFTIAVWPAFVGWVVGRTHRAQQAAMVVVYAISLVAYSIWYYTANYSEITRMPIPNQFGFDIEITCVALAFTLAGGFLQKPPVRN